MADELQVREQQQVSNESEETRPGPVFLPAVDILESERAITVLADMPGVSAEQLQIDVNDGVLTILGGTVDPPGSDRQRLTTEYTPGRYKRQFNVSEQIDQEQIEAKLTQGVLRLTLPKVEKAQPRKITVQAG